jgi:hypothetical protein
MPVPVLADDGHEFGDSIALGEVERCRGENGTSCSFTPSGFGGSALASRKLKGIPVALPERDSGKTVLTIDCLPREPRELSRRPWEVDEVSSPKLTGENAPKWNGTTSYVCNPEISTEVPETPLKASGEVFVRHSPLPSAFVVFQATPNFSEVMTLAR